MYRSIHPLCLSNIVAFLRGLTGLWPTSAPSSSQAPSRKGKVTFGPCRFISLTGEPLCSCQTGICVSSISTVDNEIRYLNCRHPLADHLDYAEDTDYEEPMDHGSIISALRVLMICILI